MSGKKPGAMCDKYLISNYLRRHIESTDLKYTSNSLSAFYLNRVASNSVFINLKSALLF